MANSQKYFLLTIDVEDWFQVENFKSRIPFDSWPARQLRVEKNTHRLLDLFDSVNVGLCGSVADFSAGPQRKLQATFFVLGWIAERRPHLVREISSRGHEVASHGYNHGLCTQLPAGQLKQDLTASKKLLEDLTGAPVAGYRAPSFAINDEILNIIKECGYHYDSSYNSFNLNPRYGAISLSGLEKRGIAYNLGNNFHELPVSNLEFDYPFSFQLSAMSSGQNDKKRFVLPWGGGGYFRLIPAPVFRSGVKAVLKKKGTYLFYMHPWELDPRQPKITEASALYKFRHYLNLKNTQAQLVRMITAFRHCEFLTCKSYLEKISF